MALRTVGVKLAADIAGYRDKLRAAGMATKDFGSELDRAAKANKLDRVADSAARMGLVAVAGFGAVVAASAKFDKQMSAVQAATHATAGEMDSLRAAAMQAGKDTSFSATEAAQGIEELSKAGVSTADVLNGGLAGALDLAAAGGLDVAEAAETAASAMTQFKLQGTAVPHIADLLAAAAGKAQGSVHDMGMALNQAGLVSSQMGLSIEDTTGTLAAFASAGLMGSDAGTSLKTALLMLANPTGKAADLMQELGINAYDASGNFVGVTELAGQLQTKLSGLTQEQRNAALATIFGSDAIRAASVLYEQGATGIQGWIDKTNEAGYASETARARTDNLAGDVERLTGSLETLAIQAGSGTNTGMRTLTQAANGAVDAFASLPGPVQTTLTVVAGLSGAGLLGAAGLIKVRGTAKEALAQLAEMGPTGERAAKGLGKVGSVAGKLGIAGVAAFGLYEGFRAFGGWVDSFSDPVVRDVDKMTTSLKEFGDTGKVTGELAKAFGNDLSGLARDIKTLADTQAVIDQVNKSSGGQFSKYSIGSGPSGPGAGAKSQAEVARKQPLANISAVDASLAQLASSGGASAAKIAFEQLAAATGIALDKLPKYAAAAQGAASANTGLAKGFGDVTTNTRTMGQSLQQAVDAGQSLIDVWNQLNGATLSLDEANLAAKEAVNAVSEAFKTHGKTLAFNSEQAKANRAAIEGNSEAALRNRILVGKSAEAAAAAAQAKYEESGSVAAATATYDQHIAALRKELKDAGLTKAQIDRLIATYGKMPTLKNTKVTADTKQASGAIAHVNEQLNNINGKTVKTYVKVVTIGNFDRITSNTGGGRERNNRWGGLYEHAATGLLREASMFSARGPARYAFAEPATGGELFAPRYGDMDRIKSMVGYGIENWWGGWKNWLPGMPTQSAAAAPTSAAPQWRPGEFAREIRAALAGVHVVMDGRTVGQIEGRQADLLARGG